MRIDADASLGGRYCLPAQFTIYATKQPKTHNRQPIFIYFYLLIFSLPHTRNPLKKQEIVLQDGIFYITLCR